MAKIKLKTFKGIVAARKNALYTMANGDKVYAMGGEMAEVGAEIKYVASPSSRTVQMGGRSNAWAESRDDYSKMFFRQYE
jgi:hypothetical protein